MENAGEEDSPTGLRVDELVAGGNLKHGGGALPALAIERTAPDTVLISWPTGAGAADARLRHSTDLLVWEDAGVLVIDDDGLNLVSIQVGADAYFRLER